MNEQRVTARVEGVMKFMLDNPDKYIRITQKKNGGGRVERREIANRIKTSFALMGIKVIQKDQTYIMKIDESKDPA